MLKHHLTACFCFVGDGAGAAAIPHRLVLRGYPDGGTATLHYLRRGKEDGRLDHRRGAACCTQVLTLPVDVNDDPQDATDAFRFPLVKQQFLNLTRIESE